MTDMDLRQVAYVKAGPKYGDIYLAILPDDAWDTNGNPLHDIITMRPDNTSSGALTVQFWVSTDRSQGCPTLGLMFHHGQTLEELKGWAVTYGIQELRWIVEESGD